MISPPPATGRRPGPVRDAGAWSGEAPAARPPAPRARTGPLLRRRGPGPHTPAPPTAKRNSTGAPAVAARGAHHLCDATFSPRLSRGPRPAAPRPPALRARAAAALPPPCRRRAQWRPPRLVCPALRPCQPRQRAPNTPARAPAHCRTQNPTRPSHRPRQPGRQPGALGTGLLCTRAGARRGCERAAARCRLAARARSGARRSSPAVPSSSPLLRAARMGGAPFALPVP